jgi:YggT family protein
MSLIHLLITLFVWCLILQALLSWFPSSPNSTGLNAFKAALNSITSPVLNPIRRAIPPVRFGAVGVDLSLLIAVFGLQLINSFI